MHIVFCYVSFSAISQRSATDGHRAQEPTSAHGLILIPDWLGIKVDGEPDWPFGILFVNMFAARTFAFHAPTLPHFRRGSMYDRSMKRVNLFLSEKQIEALKRLARKTGLSYSELIRRAIDKFLRAERREEK
jgi:hypothetical protein